MSNTPMGYTIEFKKGFNTEAFLVISSIQSWFNCEIQFLSHNEDQGVIVFARTEDEEIEEFLDSQPCVHEWRIGL